MPTLHDFNATSIEGDDVDLSQYRGKVVLVVNTASNCGFTPQYEGLESLYAEYADRGLVILGFPCNQFGKQEQGDEGEIASFCQRNYGVSFPMFAKIDVNGKNAHPVFEFLRKEQKGLVGDRIKWNFTKFLVDAEGRPVKRYGSTVTPDKIAADIERLLPATSSAD